MDSNPVRHALVTGATGYVGALLVQRLVQEGWAVRALSRRREKAESMAWAPHLVAPGASARAGEVEVFEGDASDPEDVRQALEGIETAWYLMHSMGTGKDFAREEAGTARVFAEAAARSGLSRIVFLGGLHPEEEELSEHLGSRVQVGRILMASGVPTAALQAGVVVGTGSTSFHMLRHLAERLPGVIGPRWIRHRITPISERDVVHYLVRAADLPPEQNRAFDIGGPEDLQYVEMMKRYARRIGLPRPLALTAPVTTPRLGAHWISLVTPVGTAIATPLIGSLLHDTVVEERDLEALVGTPEGGNQSFEEAVDAAVADLDGRRWFTVVGGVGAAVACCWAAGGVLDDLTRCRDRSQDRPAGLPAGAVHCIVRTAIYADLAAMESLVLADSWEAGEVDRARQDAGALALNLLLGAGWSALSSGGRRPVLSKVWAGVLLASSADLVRRAWRCTPERGVLLAPYAGWTAFSALLQGAMAPRDRARKRGRRGH